MSKYAIPHTSVSLSLRQELEHWARRYTCVVEVQHRIVNRTLMVLIDDPELVAEQPKASVLSLLRSVAFEELRGRDQASRSKGLLAGVRVLVVEDEYVQALDVTSALAAKHAEIVGPFADAAGALEALNNQDVDFALLDIRLVDGECYVVADELKRRRTPFVFLTGFERDVLPKRFGLARHYLKPLHNDEIASIVSAAVFEKQCGDQTRHRW